jgi:hypothetical protein
MSDLLEEEVIVANAALGDDGDNYEDVEQQIDPAKLGDKLVQANNQKGFIRELQLYDGRYLLIREGSIDAQDRRQYRVNLAWVSSEPQYTRLVDWKWLYISLLLGAITATFVILAITHKLTMDYSMIGGTISLTLTVLTSLIFAYRLRDEFTFTGFYGAAAWFLMENKRPTQQVFDMFFVQLQQAIDNAKRDLSVNERLIGELKSCRRLRDEGIISEDAYTETRTAIFSHEQYKA